VQAITYEPGGLAALLTRPQSSRPRLRPEKARSRPRLRPERAKPRPKNLVLRPRLRRRLNINEYV